MEPLHMKCIADQSRLQMLRTEDDFYLRHSCAWLQGIKRAGQLTRGMIRQSWKGAPRRKVLRAKKA